MLAAHQQDLDLNSRISARVQNFSCHHIFYRGKLVDDVRHIDSPFHYGQRWYFGSMVCHELYEVTFKLTHATPADLTRYEPYPFSRITHEPHDLITLVNVPVTDTSQFHLVARGEASGKEGC